MAFMISRETENVHSSKDVEDAFKALTDGADKDFVTEQELYQVLNIIYLYNILITVGTHLVGISLCEILCPILDLTPKSASYFRQLI